MKINFLVITTLLLFQYSLFYWSCFVLLPQDTGGLDGFASLTLVLPRLINILIAVISSIAAVYFFRKKIFFLLITSSITLSVTAIYLYGNVLKTIYSNGNNFDELQNNGILLPNFEQIGFLIIASIVFNILGFIFLIKYLLYTKNAVEKIKYKLEAYGRWYKLQMRK